MGYLSQPEGFGCVGINTAVRAFAREGQGKGPIPMSWGGMFTHDPSHRLTLPRPVAAFRHPCVPFTD